MHPQEGGNRLLGARLVARHSIERMQALVLLGVTFGFEQRM
jgi:hypothetical protein